MAKNIITITLKYLKSSKNYFVYSGGKPPFPQDNVYISMKEIFGDAPKKLELTISGVSDKKKKSKREDEDDDEDEDEDDE
jgi:hypothetical protein